MCILKPIYFFCFSFDRPIYFMINAWTHLYHFILYFSLTRLPLLPTPPTPKLSFYYWTWLSLMFIFTCSISSLSEVTLAALVLFIQGVYPRFLISRGPRLRIWSLVRHFKSCSPYLPLGLISNKPWNLRLASVPTFGYQSGYDFFVVISDFQGFLWYLIPSSALQLVNFYFIPTFCIACSRCKGVFLGELSLPLSRNP